MVSAVVSVVVDNATNEYCVFVIFTIPIRGKVIIWNHFD